MHRTRHRSSDQFIRGICRLADNTFAFG
jgi:hypothetical protein